MNAAHPTLNPRRLRSPRRSAATARHTTTVTSRDRRRRLAASSSRANGGPSSTTGTRRPRRPRCAAPRAPRPAPPRRRPGPASLVMSGTVCFRAGPTNRGLPTHALTRARCAVPPPAATWMHARHRVVPADHDPEPTRVGAASVPHHPRRHRPRRPPGRALATVRLVEQRHHQHRCPHTAVAHRRPGSFHRLRWNNRSTVAQPHPRRRSPTTCPTPTTTALRRSVVPARAQQE
jgi:hypothetical protein